MMPGGVKRVEGKQLLRPVREQFDQPAALDQLARAELQNLSDTRAGLAGAEHRSDIRHHQPRADRYRQHLPLLPGAVEAVLAAAQRCPVAIASSSPPALINEVLRVTGLDEIVKVALSSELTGAGKPAPDVYLAAAKGLGVDPARCVAVEDSTNGIKSALNAGMIVVAVPNSHFPPDPQVVAQAARTITDVRELAATLDLLSGL